MLFVCGCDHDPVTGVLTVRLCSPSKIQRAVHEYRGVDRATYERLVAARPHWQRLLEEEVVPTHAMRRQGESTWHEPAAMVTAF